MLKLSEFLGVNEDVDFKINNWSYTYKIKDNKLLAKRRDDDDDYFESNVQLRELIDGKITILSKQPILTDTERDYLKAVIYPVRDKAYQVIKWKSPFESKEYIRIILNDGDAIYLYSFETSTQFKGMEADKEYTLADLGLKE